RHPEVARHRGAQRPRAGEVAHAVTGEAAGHFAADDPGGDLPFRPARQGEHQEGDGDHEEADAQHQLGGHEPCLRIADHGSCSFTTEASTVNDHAGTPGSHPWSTTRARACIARSVISHDTCTERPEAPASRLPSTSRARRSQSAGDESTAAPARAPSSMAERTTPPA